MQACAIFMHIACICSVNARKPMTQLHTILMADVIASRTQEGSGLAGHLRALTEVANEQFAGVLESPMTVTLGDEFQGIVTSPAAGVDLLLWLEHRLRMNPLERETERRAYQLRYVLHQGVVESPLNRNRAHGMLGPGLTTARELLNEDRRGLPRFRMALADEAQSRRLGQLFGVLDALTADWRPKDFDLIEALFGEADSVELGRRFNRHRTSIDRRRETLKIDACLTLERLLRDLAS